jgi:cold shock CspA family protein
VRGKIKFVNQANGGYGFIIPDEGGADIHFYLRDFPGSRPTIQDAGSAVEFELLEDDLGRHARSVRLLDPIRPQVPANTPLRAPRSGEYLLEWAYLGHVPTMLRDLHGQLLGERWEFLNAIPDDEKPFPILYSYLIQTFTRLTIEKKVVVEPGGGLAVFNTGLVDRRYESIYALFRPQQDTRAPWRLASFCTAGEGTEGKNLVRYINPLPSPPHYFETPSDLLYDVRARQPDADWEHSIIDRIGRFPAEFLEDHRPAGFAYRSAADIPDEEREVYFQSLGKAIEEDARTYRRIISSLRDAIQLSLKRVAWNYRTAVPQYYPRVRKLQLLLPLCLIRDDQVDIALAVEKTPSGSYLGNTILPLDWAYKNARLVCRPDSDWLRPDIIVGGTEEEEP